MYLAENGRYYFNKDKKNEFNRDIFEEVISPLFKSRNNSYIMYKNNKQFIFTADFGDLKVINENKDHTELSFNPIDITFKTEKNNQRITIFSLEQYQKAIKYFNFDFPWSKNNNLSKKNLVHLIYGPFSLNKSIEIENLDCFEINSSNEQMKYNKLKDLSKYINLYIKNKINLNDYPEKDFLNEKEYILDPEKEFVYYSKEKRFQIFLYIEKVCKNKKEYFFTGNDSIGKTLTLLGFTNMKSTYNKKAYFNFEVLYQSDEYFKIIAYESRYLFENKEKWKKTFLDIQGQDIKSPFKMILNIIKQVSSSRNSQIN